MKQYFFHWLFENRILSNEIDQAVFPENPVSERQDPIQTLVSELQRRFNQPQMQLLKNTYRNPSQTLGGIIKEFTSLPKKSIKLNAQDIYLLII